MFIQYHTGGMFVKKQIGDGVNFTEGAQSEKCPVPDCRLYDIIIVNSFILREAEDLKEHG